MSFCPKGRLFGLTKGYSFLDIYAHIKDVYRNVAEYREYDTIRAQDSGCSIVVVRIVWDDVVRVRFSAPRQEFTG